MPHAHKQTYTACMKQQYSNKQEELLVLKRPRVTEKATLLAERSDKKAYTFEIDAHANKAEVAIAIKKLFGVTPAKIAITINPRKAVFVRIQRRSKKSSSLFKERRQNRDSLVV